MLTALEIHNIFNIQYKHNELKKTNQIIIKKDIFSILLSVKNVKDISTYISPNEKYLG